MAHLRLLQKEAGFESVTLQDILARQLDSRVPLAVEDTSTVASLLRTLEEGGIVSAPVASAQTGACYTVIDHLDLLVLLLQQLGIIGDDGRQRNPHPRPQSPSQQFKELTIKEVLERLGSGRVCSAVFAPLLAARQAPFSRVISLCFQRPSYSIPHGPALAKELVEGSRPRSPVAAVVSPATTGSGEQKQWASEQAIYRTQSTDTKGTRASDGVLDLTPLTPALSLDGAARESSHRASPPLAPGRPLAWRRRGPARQGTDADNPRSPSRMSSVVLSPVGMSVVSPNSSVSLQPLSVTPNHSFGAQRAADSRRASSSQHMTGLAEADPRPPDSPRRGTLPIQPGQLPTAFEGSPVARRRLKQIQRIELGTSEDGQSTPSPPGTPLPSSLTPTGGPWRERRPRRLVLTDHGERPLRVLSTTDVLKFLVQQPGHLRELGARTVAELLGDRPPPPCVEVSTPLGSAYGRMWELRAEALGIVDAAGRLVGNLSVSDLRVFDSFRAVALAALGDLSRFVVGQGGRKAEVVRVPQTASLREAVDKCVKHNVTRVYVTDDDGRPTGAITHHDILRLVNRGGNRSPVLTPRSDRRGSAPRVSVTPRSEAGRQPRAFAQHIDARALGTRPLVLQDLGRVQDPPVQE